MPVGKICLITIYTVSLLCYFTFYDVCMQIIFKIEFIILELLGEELQQLFTRSDIVNT